MGIEQVLIESHQILFLIQVKFNSPYYIGIQCVVPSFAPWNFESQKNHQRVKDITESIFDSQNSLLSMKDYQKLIGVDLSKISISNFRLLQCEKS